MTSTSPIKKTCHFCSSQFLSNNSNEDIIPRWLQKELEITDEIIQPTHLDYDGNVQSQRGPHRIKNLLCGNICSTCNNGWMSQLEVKAKRLLPKLIYSRAAINDLNATDRFTLARWTLKTAITLNLGSNFIRYIPIHHCQHVMRMRDVLPTGVYVFANQHRHNRQFYWFQGSIWRIHDPLGKRKSLPVSRETASKWYKTSFQFQDLMLMVAYMQAPNLQLLIDRGIHIPVWPMLGEISSYQSNSFFSSSDPAITLSQFHSTLCTVLLQ